jgi:spore maturation protein CgeB
MFTDEFETSILREIKKITKSIAWFSDDHWRFDNYSKYYARYFSWVITTYSKAVEKYKNIDVENVIRSQWAANTNIYKKMESSGFFPDVSFVGTWSRPRQRIIGALEKAGINVAVYGSGWKLGRIDKDKMLEIFSNSKISLALNPAPSLFNVNSLARLFFKRSRNKFVLDFHLWGNLKSWSNRRIPQIKARHFEIPACKGFLMTSMVDDLDKYFRIGEEVVIYKDTSDLIVKIKHYLENDIERMNISRAGYQRVLKDHIYEKRFDEIFKTIFG